jgi:hypothetical protein
LRDLETDVKVEAASAGEQVGQTESTAEERGRSLPERFDVRLAALVGPEAEDEADPLLRTLTAVLLAHRHLTVTYGLPDPAAEELEEASRNLPPPEWS